MTAPQPDWTSDVIRTVLPNGLIVLIEPNASAPVIASVAHVRAGYFDEPDELVGISHVLEHMFFKGTPSRPDGSMADETQRLGGYLNAGTIYDKTIYYTVVPSGPDVVRQVVDIQADGLMNAAIAPDSLERELEVIIQEANRKLDSPSSVVTETLYEQLFSQHRMRRWRIGKEDELRELTSEDVRAYYRTRYAPERTILGLVGDFDADEVLDIVRSRYESWVRVDADVPGSPPETDPPQASFRVLTGDVRRPQIAFGWRTGGADHDDAVALDMAAGVLGSGRNSWLSRAVRRTGLASSASAHHYTPSDVGVFSLSLAGPAERIQEATSTGLGLVNRLAEKGPASGDMERVRSLLAVGLSRRLEMMDTRALAFCQYEARGGLHLLNEEYRRMFELTPEEVQRAAATHLPGEQVCGTVYASEMDRSCVAAEAWPQSGPVPVLPPIGDRRIAPMSTGSSRRFRSIGPLAHLESETADLLAREKKGTGLAHVAVYCPRIRELETDGNAGVSALASRAMLRGTPTLDADQIAHVAERLGGTLSPVVLAGGVGWTITIPVPALADAVSLIHHVMTEADPSDENVTVERDLQISDARRAHDDMFGFPILKVIRLAHTGSSHGLPLLGEPDVLKKMDGLSVRLWAKRMRSRKLAAVVVGDAPREELLKALSPFTDWPGVAASDRGDPVAWSSGLESEHREKAQTALAMAFNASPHGRDRLEMMVLGALLSGMSGRLFTELREKRSLGYTVNASAWQRHTAGAMLTYVATDPAREDEARDAMLDVLASISGQPPSDDEFDRAARSAAGAIQLKRQSSGALASEISEAWNRGDLVGLDQQGANLMNVKNGAVVELAKRTFEDASRAEFVLRGDSALEHRHGQERP